MAQFDVFDNPVSAARRAYPFVVSLQSNLTQGSRDQIVAPLVPVSEIPKTTGRLTPAVTLNGIDHVVLVPALASVRTRDLVKRVDSVAAQRSELFAAIDYLFFGV